MPTPQRRRHGSQRMKGWFERRRRPLARPGKKIKTPGWKNHPTTGWKNHPTEAQSQGGKTTLLCLGGKTHLLSISRVGVALVVLSFAVRFFLRWFGSALRARRSAPAPGEVDWLGHELGHFVGHPGHLGHR